MEKKNQFAVNFISGCVSRKPTALDVTDEVEMAIMTQFRTAYRLLACEEYGECNQELVVTLLFTALAYWDRLMKDIAHCLRETDEDVGTLIRKSFGTQKGCDNATQAQLQ